MKKKTTTNVYDFYNSSGWQENKKGVTTDTEAFEDLRACTTWYNKNSRLKLLQFIPKKGDSIIDFASGPIQFPEYLLYSEHFKKRICIDFSKQALAQAKKKLGAKGEYICKDILDVTLPKNSCDCALSLHTIYHIDKDKQADAVHKLIDAVKPGKNVVIIYSNPKPLLKVLRDTFIKPFFPRFKQNINRGPELYFHPHPLKWWKQFSHRATVRLYSWRIMDSTTLQMLIPNNIIGKWMLFVAATFEKLFPKLSAHLFQYPIIVLKKKKE